MTDLTDANMRLLKAGGDVCRALGVYAESPEAAVVNELVRAARHQAAEHIRAARDDYDPDTHPTPWLALDYAANLAEWRVRHDRP